MKKRKILLVLTSLFVFTSGLFAKGDTYTYDYWSKIQRSPDVYTVSHVVYADDLKLDTPLKNPSNLFCYGNLVYVADTDNNRIIELEYTEKKILEFRRVIDRFNANGQDVVETFSGPKDVFIAEDGSYFIADTKNGRVVKLDKDLNYLFALTEPDDPTYAKGKEFLPEKVVADVKGRSYVLAKNVNKGFIKYDFDGTFTGFYGAGEVTYDFIDLMWKRFFSTRAQREQMVSFVPTEYCNAYMDHEGFIYAVTKTFEWWDLLSDKAKPIRRLNALGGDILVKNAEYLPIGDLQWNNAAGIKDPSKFSDITVLDNDVYLAVDESRGRIFAYNNQGYLLFAFGGRGNIDGHFRQPSSIEHVGKDLFVLDTMNASITVFTPTVLGNLIYQATEQYAVGDYDDSARTWEEVLKYNGNYDLAYIGLGKSYLRQDRFKEAMDCFELKKDRKNYSKAYMYYRKEWIEANIGWVFALIIAVIVVPFIVKKVMAFIRELKSL